ncbi:MAG TPA: hypothetical protein VF188_09820 [Longimicrobiales bacterium]
MLTLHRLNLGYRFLYTGVLLFMTAGTVVHGVHQHARAGILPDHVAAWYRGNADDPAATVLLFPRPLEEVVADVWLTLTTYTFALLIFGAILYRSDAAPTTRAALITAYALGGLAAAAAPPLIRYVSPRFALLDSAAFLVLPALALVMTALALRDMWLRRAAGPRVDPGRAV